MDEVAALRERVHRPLTAAFGRWDELLHPRGKDGKFITKGGFISGLFQWFDGDSSALGSEHSQRAEVVQFLPRSNDRVAVWVKDPERPGQVGMADASQVVEAAAPKARRASSPLGRDGQPIAVGQAVELNDMPGFRHGQRGKYEVFGTVLAIEDTPSGPVVQVELTDERWDPDKFGAVFAARPDQIATAGYKKPKKADTPTKKPTPKPKANHNDTGVAPPRSPLSGYTVSPDGPGFEPLMPPDEWTAMGAPARLAWLKEQMEADFTAWRGQPTVIDFTGYDSGIALNLANTYRDLANWDPDTSRRIDKFIPAHMDTEQLGGSAIAVAHPGTAHPGGIGPKIKDSAIVLRESYFASMAKWKKDTGGGVPWSMSDVTGDPTLTLVHEFAHQRQFRLLDVAMREVGAAWSPVVMSDGFGLVPDSSNWPETQKLRYDIPKLAPTTYGQSKSSEGFAEAWAARAVGYSSPQLNKVLDDWDAYMGLPLALPKDRHTETTPYESLGESERTAFWQQVKGVLDLPGLRKHYSETAAAYDAWAAAPAPAAVTAATPISDKWRKNPDYSAPTGDYDPHKDFDEKKHKRDRRGRFANKNQRGKGKGTARRRRPYDDSLPAPKVVGVQSNERPSTGGKTSDNSRPSVAPTGPVADLIPVSSRQDQIAKAIADGWKTEQRADGSATLFPPDDAEPIELSGDAELLSTPEGRKDFLDYASKQKWPVEAKADGSTVIKAPWGEVTVPAEDPEKKT